MQEFINEYGKTILYTLLCGLGAWLGTIAKKYFDRIANTKEKKEIARDVVRFTQQVYSDLNGEEKLQKALEASEELLAERGITCSALEMRVLIESAVNSFKGGWENGSAESLQEN